MTTILNNWEAPGFYYFFQFLSDKRYLFWLYSIYLLFLGVLFIDSLYTVSFPKIIVMLWVIFISTSLIVIHRSYTHSHSSILISYLIVCMGLWMGAVATTGGLDSSLFHYIQVLLILNAFSASFRLNSIGGVVYIGTLGISMSFYTTTFATFFSIFSEIAIHLLTIAVGCLLSVAMSNYQKNAIHWQRKAMTDSLTGLSNRQGLMQWWKKQRPDSGWLGVLDVNDFKYINDTYGHDLGDQVLIYCAKDIQSTFTSSIFMARIGGDEFLFYISASLDEKAIREYMDFSLRKVEKRTNLPVSAALGLAKISTARCVFPSLYREADRNMYQYKNKQAAMRNKK